MMFTVTWRPHSRYWFMRCGMPECVTTGNGTESAGAFQHQLQRLGIAHVQASTYHLQCNREPHANLT